MRMLHLYDSAELDVVGYFSARERNSGYAGSWEDAPTCERCGHSCDEQMSCGGVTLCMSCAPIRVISFD